MDILKLLTSGTKFKKDAKPVFTTSKPQEQPTQLDFFQTEEQEEPVLEIKTEEQANAIRKQHKIKITGTDCPFPIESFHELYQRFQIKSFMKKNIKECGYDAPTPIQMQAFPIMLHRREMMACAPTGSGKTLAFLFGMIHHLKQPQKSTVRGLIITPTRELAQQIYREFQKLTKGKPFKAHVLSKANLATKGSLDHCDLLISTPLRLVTGIQDGSVVLKNVEHLILDEADKLLELGFLEQMDEIFAQCSPQVQKSMFSATLPSSVEQLASSIMKDPIRVIIGLKNTATTDIDQKLLYVGQENGKLVAIRQLIHEGFKPPVLIFVQSIERAKELFNELVYDGINVDVIHSDRTQAQRDLIISNFRTGKVWVLIATELMSRGIDFKGVQTVINYDFPQTVASYIHRIGRTGRAGRQGQAITYFTKDDAPYLKSIVNVMRESGCDVPEWMLNLKKPTKQMLQKLKKRPIERQDIKTISKYDLKRQKKKSEMVQASKRRKQMQE
ncbi:P-loop containing nucleoside triphosphate hydrolase protein [Gorgonomyces haynaldii]|nr:P-loop containing nucleoside triphosphate hydrolase protein [Gorgonomyces haynaldii]